MKNFTKKNILLSIALLCSTLVCSPIFAGQDPALTESEETLSAEETKAGMALLEATYQASIKSYKKSDVTDYEITMADVIKKYMLSCAKDKSCAKNIDSIQQQVTKTIMRQILPILPQQ